MRVRYLLQVDIDAAAFRDPLDGEEREFAWTNIRDALEGVFSPPVDVVLLGAHTVHDDSKEH